MHCWKLVEFSSLRVRVCTTIHNLVVHGSGIIQNLSLQASWADPRDGTGGKYHPRWKKIILKKNLVGGTISNII